MKWICAIVCFLVYIWLVFAVLLFQFLWDFNFDKASHRTNNTVEFFETFLEKTFGL